MGTDAPSYTFYPSMEFLTQNADSLFLSSLSVQTSNSEYSDIVVEPSCLSLTACAYLHDGQGINQVTSVESIVENLDSESAHVLTEKSYNKDSIYGNIEGKTLSTRIGHSVFWSGIEISTYGDREIVKKHAGAFGDRTPWRGALSGVWNGLMTGVSEDSDGFLKGDAKLTYSVSDSGGILDAEFSDIQDFETETDHSVSSVEFNDISVSFYGSFKQGSNGDNIQGAFYGDYAEAISGTFEKEGIFAAYGAFATDATRAEDYPFPEFNDPSVRRWWLDEMLESLDDEGKAQLIRGIYSVEGIYGGNSDAPPIL